MSLICANPACGTGFDHQQGRFFRLHLCGQNGEAVQNFWLCGRCAEAYTIDYLKGSIVLMSRAPHMDRVRPARHLIVAA